MRVASELIRHAIVFIAAIVIVMWAFEGTETTLDQEREEDTNVQSN